MFFNFECHYAECDYVEYDILSVARPSVVIPSVLAPISVRDSQLKSVYPLFKNLSTFAAELNRIF